MQAQKTDKEWVVDLDERRMNLGFLDIIRFLEKLNDEILEKKIPNLSLCLNLEKLSNINSSVMSQFIILQMSLVRFNGSLSIINANYLLKSVFDLVLLDKVINVQYREGAEELEEE